MSELKEGYNPEQNQLQLISIYKSIPARNVAVDRMTSAINNIDVQGLHPEIAEHYITIAVKAGIQHSENSELLSRKKKQLEELMNTADITPTTKFLIRQAFDASFTFGRDDAWTIFETIGITDGSRKEAGIFSDNPESRKEIEKEIYAEQVLTLRDLLRDQREGESDDAILEQSALIMRFGEEFERLYGETID